MLLQLPPVWNSTSPELKYQSNTSAFVERPRHEEPVCEKDGGETDGPFEYGFP